MDDLKVTSPAFKDGDWIPNNFSGYGDDLSPEINIVGIVDGAVSMVITFDDLGHPIQPGYNHWIAWNLPPVENIPEGLPKGDIIDKPIHAEQGLAYGKHCYRGPKPPFNWNHDYQFNVYILDTMLTISTNSNKKAVMQAMDGHVIQMGNLSGKYQRKHI